MPSQVCATAASEHESYDSSEFNSILCWQQQHKSPGFLGVHSSHQTYLPTTLPP